MGNEMERIATALGIAVLGGVASVVLVGIVEIIIALLNRTRRENMFRRSLRENIRKALH